MTMIEIDHIIKKDLILKKNKDILQIKFIYKIITNNNRDSVRYYTFKKKKNIYK